MLSTTPTRWQLLVLSAVLVLSPNAAAAGWIRVETPNFIVFGDASDKRVREVAEQFERFRQALGRVLPGAATTAAVPTVVVVFNTQRSFEPYRPRFNGKPVELAGYFVATNNQNLVALTVENRARALQTVFHEYAHLVVANLVRDLPAWVSEGLAEYYSTFVVEDDGRTAVMGTPIREHLLRLNDERLIPHEELLDVDHTSSLYNEGERRSVFYSQSWALVHMLTMGKPGRSKELAEYIALTSTGIPSGQAWARVFGATNVNYDIQKYVNRLTLSAVRYRFDEAIPTVRSAVAVPAESDIEAALADLLDHVRMRDEATARLEKAVSMQPSSARARALLGLRRFEQNRTDEARSLFLEALTDRNDWLAQYHAATGLTRLVDRSEGEEQTKLAALARQALAIVDIARPRLPNALAMRARISATTGTDLDEALEHIQQARTLAPGREDYAFEEAHVRLSRREFAEARAVIGPLLSMRYHTSIRERARSLMAQVVRVESAVRAQPSPSADAAAAVDLDGTPHEKLALQPVYRKLQAGEQRTEGMLERIECTRRGIVLHVRTGDAEARFTAPRFEAIDFITYRSDGTLKVTCQPRIPADAVYVTWRPPVAPATDAIAIAVEFLPQR
jgi:tetratricopeptide (TPR) repeat protein